MVLLYVSVGILLVIAKGRTPNLGIEESEASERSRRRISLRH